MELPFVSFKVMLVRSKIRIGMVARKTAKKIYADMLRLYGNCMTIPQVRNWRRDFLVGRMSLVDKPHGQKLRFSLFDRRATRTWDCILRCDEMDQISTFLPWRENFTLEHDASGVKSIPPGNFTYFSRPTTKNYKLVFLTVLRVNGGFDRRATIILSRYFRPMVRLMGG